MKDMREDPHKLGIGQTGSGGGYGMAALEGLVAAIEVCTARPPYPHALNRRPAVRHPAGFGRSMSLRPLRLDYVHTHQTAMACHLIHFASTPPDPAERPLWNVSTALDSVTWDTLPSELRKVRAIAADRLTAPDFDQRGIHYSNVLLRQIPRFTQVQAAVRFSGSVRSPHVFD